MSDFDDINLDESAQGRGGLTGRRLVTIVAVAIVVVGVVVWWMARQGAQGPESPRRVESVPEGSRNVTLFFASADEPVLYSETRETAVGRQLDEQVRRVMEALIAGPQSDRGISALPAGTTLLSVMVDADSGTVYLDFSSELVAAHPGGSAAEYCTVASIVRTVGENFPEVQRVQILVDGSQVETIAGHLRADEPFAVREWR
jgi:spore germination protein GerM